MDWSHFASSAIGGLVVAGAGAWFALRRFRAERVWDRKVVAYSDILTGLFHLQSYASQAIEHIEENKALGNELNLPAGRAGAASAEIRRAAALGTFLLSADAAKRLQRLVTDLDDPHHNQDIYEEAVADLKVAEEALADLREIARRDLGL